MGTNGFLGGLLGREAHEDDDPGIHHHPGEESGTKRRRRSGTRGRLPKKGTTSRRRGRGV
jgi:hypothetical protein